MREALPEEKFVGIEVFLTEEEGIGGKLRSIPEDFVVMEVPIEREEKKDGKYIIARLEAKNWETNHLIKVLAKKLHISRKRIGLAGTKDKRAITTRIISIYYPEGDLPEIALKDVRLVPLYRSDKGIEIGDLKGNKFAVRIRNVNMQKEEIIDRIEGIGKQLRYGFPNFYGIQRFGVVRPVTHLVGKLIIRGEFEKAVETYLTFSTELEKEEEREARSRFGREKDALKALEYFPKTLTFERTVLNELAAGRDALTAFRKLPLNLLTMYVYAYQSYIFNKILSRRIRDFDSPEKAIEGDIILPADDEKPIPVTKDNVEKINKMISKGKCYVTALLPGYKAEFAKGYMGEIERKVMEEEKVDPRDFIVPEMPEVSSAGGRRCVLAPFFNFSWELEKDDLNQGRYAVKMSFFLKKGCYATSLLREFMKADSITCY